MKKLLYSSMVLSITFILISGGVVNGATVPALPAIVSLLLGGNGGSNIQGQVTFDIVPAVIPVKLDYENTRQAPARGVLIEAIVNNSAVASTVTDSSGMYKLQVPVATGVVLRVSARLQRTTSPTYDFQVVDNTNNRALYTMQSSPFDVVDAKTQLTKNLNADSGWGGTSYTSTRVAAPFAILDTVYRAVLMVQSAATIDMPPLEINWSVNNTTASGDIANGQIVASHYSTDGKLYILGKANTDTDEYDDHVIAHEWGHYFENNFSRADSIGGPHSNGDKLDPRVAFSEGFGNAISGMIMNNQYYIDTYGSSQNGGFTFDLEDNSFDESAEGWFSEASIQAILYDIFDTNNDGVDTVSMGFKPIYDVLTGSQKSTNAFTTIFSFAHYLKSENLINSSGINNLLTGEQITSQAVDAFDSTATETNNGGYSTMLPVYVELSSIPSNLCVSDAAGTANKLTNKRFFYFTVGSSGSYSIAANPNGVDGMDPDIYLYHQGIQQAKAWDMGTNDLETLTVDLDPGTYVGVLNDYNSSTAFRCAEMTLTLN